MYEETIRISEEDITEFFEVKPDSRFAVLEMIAYKWLRQRWPKEKILCNFYGFDFAIPIRFHRSVVYELIECKVNTPMLGTRQWKGLAEMIEKNIKVGSIWIFTLRRASNTVLFTLIDTLKSVIGEVYIYVFDYLKYLKITRNFIVRTIFNDELCEKLFRKHRVFSWT